jgi:hypothetical protein
MRPQERRAEVAPVAAHRGEANPGNRDDERALQPGKDQLKVAGFSNAQIIQSRHEPRRDNREDL